MVTGREAPPGAPNPPGSAPLDRVRRALRVDLARRRHQPSNPRVLVAILAAVAIALAVDVGLVHLATSMFATTRHFSHFRFADYASLTIVGVVVGGAAWPVVTRVTSTPRWLFFRLAVAVTILLWLPDGWLLLRGETARGVGVLMVLHLVIAIVTYNLVVRIAPVGPAEELDGGAPAGLSDATVRRIWGAMAGAVALVMVLGWVLIVAVPFRRPDAVLPPRGVWLYAAHGALGILLAAGALVVLVLSPVTGRMARIGAVTGGIGVVVGLAGGVFATFQSTRLLGMAAMMVGVVVAGFGYLAPTLEAMGKAEAARAEAARRELAEADAARARAPGTNGKRA